MKKQAAYWGIVILEKNGKALQIGYWHSLVKPYTFYHLSEMYVCGNAVKGGRKIAQWTKVLISKLGDPSLIPTWTHMVEGEKLSSDRGTLALGHGYLHPQIEIEIEIDR